MAAAAAATADGGGAKSAKGGKKKLLLLAVPLLLAGVGGGVWASGLPQKWFGKAAPAPAAEAAPAPKAPVFADLPDMVANLNAGARRASFVKLKARLELARAEDQAAVAAAMPRLLDLFQTYLREMRPEELRGSAGTYRLREELIARANIAVHPTRVVDVLFTELLVQ